MLVHHLLHCGLCIFTGFLGNLVAMGGVVELIHNITDIFMNFTKCLNSTKYQTQSTAVFAVTIVVWVFYRLYIFLYVIQDMFMAPLQLQPEIAFAWPIFYATGTFLSMLVCLNFYWFILMLRVMSRYFKEGIAEDNSNIVKEYSDRKQDKKIN